MMDTLIRILGEMPLFAPFQVDELETIAAQMHSVRVREGETLIRQGEAAQRFYVTVSGDYLMGFSAGRSFTLHGSGRVIGMNAILDGSAYTATATALTDGALMGLYREDMRRLIAADPRLSDKLSRTASAYRRQRQQARNIGGMEVPTDDNGEGRRG